MWLFTRHGFYSIASAANAGKPGDPPNPASVMVRARRRSHLENLQKRFQETSPYEIKEWPGRDYRFRIIIPKEIWICVISEPAREQTWSNFKDEAAAFQSEDHDYIHS